MQTWGQSRQYLFRQDPDLLEWYRNRTQLVSQMPTRTLGPRGGCIDPIIVGDYPRCVGYMCGQ